MLKQFAKSVFVGLVLCAFFVAGQCLRFGAEFSLAPPSDISISYNDLIVLLLTCIAVLLTILGIGIALLTVFGLRSVKTIATKQAFLAAKIQLEDENSALARKILKLAERSAYAGIEPLDAENEKQRGEFE